MTSVGGRELLKVYSKISELLPTQHRQMPSAFFVRKFRLCDDVLVETFHGAKCDHVVTFFVSTSLFSNDSFSIYQRSNLAPQVVWGNGSFVVHGHTELSVMAFLRATMHMLQVEYDENVKDKVEPQFDLDRVNEHVQRLMIEYLEPEGN